MTTPTSATPTTRSLVDERAADPLEAKAKAKGLNYVKLDDGVVGVIGNGAGLVMSTLDVVAYAGEEFGGAKPANFLDIGGGASAQVMADGLDIILGDPDVRAVFVNVFGGITACDEVANGIVQAIELLKARGERIDKPLVVRLDGNNAEEGQADPGRGRARHHRAGGHHGWCRAPRGRARRRGDPGGVTAMAIFLGKDSRVLVQGITGSEGVKHTRRMVASGTQVVAGVTPGKAGQAGRRDPGVRLGA